MSDKKFSETQGTPSQDGADDKSRVAPIADQPPPPPERKPVGVWGADKS